MNSICTTKCPHGEKFRGVARYVGAISCTDDCSSFVRHDIVHKIVTCSKGDVKS